MQSYRNVHVQSDELEEIPVVRRSPPARGPPRSRFKSLLIATILVVFITTIIVSIVRSKLTNNKRTASSTIRGSTTVNIKPVTRTTSTQSMSPATTHTESSSTATITSEISTTDSGTVSSTTINELPEISSSRTIINVTKELSENNIDHTLSPRKSTMAARTTMTATMISPNLLLNPGAEEQFSGWKQTGSSPVIVDSNGDFNKNYYPHSETYCFAGGYGLTGSPSKLVQRIKLLRSVQGFTKSQLDSGKLNVFVSFYYQTRHGPLSIDDMVKVDVTFRTNRSNILSGIYTGELICRSSNPGWCHYTNSTLLPAGTRSIYYVMRFYNNDKLGVNIDAYIDDNSLIII